MRQACENECLSGSNGLWLHCAQEVFWNNKIGPIVFVDAINNLLIRGCGRNYSLMIVGPVNCGKSFKLSSKSFSNPTNDKFAWTGVENWEVIFLNDYRQKSEIIANKVLLLFLEGQPVYLPFKKNIYAEGIAVARDTPTFAVGLLKLHLLVILTALIRLNVRWWQQNGSSLNLVIRFKRQIRRNS